MATKDDSLIRVELGLEGGQTLALRMTQSEYKRLREGVEGDDWDDFEAEDGTVGLDLGKVAFVKVDTDELKVGF